MSSSIRPEHEVTPVPVEHLRAVLKQFGVDEAVAAVGIRGYVKQFKEATTGGNLIGKYDDVICIVTPEECRTFLGNTDPSKLITDPTTGLGRAQLTVPQKVRYTRGIHGITRPKDQQRLAWIQSSPVSIRRWDEKLKDWGPVIVNQWIGCNMHDGSWTTTGSAACQTIVPERWKEFDTMLDSALKRHAQSKFWYVLTM